MDTAGEPSNPAANREPTENVAQMLHAMRGSEDPHLPRHYVIRQHLQHLMLTKTLKPGDQIPTEQEMMRIFSVSRITVRQAVGQLVATGSLVAKPGRGTYVAQPRIQQDLKKLTGFVEDMDTLGLKASATVVKLAVVKADYQVAEKLRLPKGARVTYIERIRLAEGQPLSFDVTYLPIDIGERIASENLQVNPVFSLLEDKYGIKLAEAEYAIEASLASSTVARHLRMRAGAPILLIERNTYDVNGRPIDYEKLYYRGDRIRYKTLLKR